MTRRPWGKDPPKVGGDQGGVGGGPGWWLEEPLWQAGLSRVAGVDEAGRGALAGPVVAAAVLLTPHQPYAYRDSKQLTAKQRERLAQEIAAHAVGWAIGCASAAEIDAVGVLHATQLAAQRALSSINPPPEGLVTDYLRLDFAGPVVAAIKADRQSLQVAAASILAKTYRDSLMQKLDDAYPEYGFATHKGYGTPCHLAALAQHGPCPEHRVSFRPVAQARLFSSL